MGNTLANIRVDAETWINIYDLSGINPNDDITVQNTGVTDLYYSVSETMPDKDSDKYRIFRRSDTITLEGGETAWVFSPQVDGLINPSSIPILVKFPANYLIEVAKGNIPGASIVTITGRSGHLGSSIEDIWGGGDLFTLDYDSETSPFEAGLDLVGSTSGATARIVIVDGSLLTIRSIDGIFESEIITDSGGGSATTSGDIIALALKVDATSGEQWEVLCESDEDSSSGVGVRTIVVVYIDGDGNEQVEVVPTNGHTASLFSTDNALCPRIVASLTYGAKTNPISAKCNNGYIVIREVTTKQLRATMVFNDKTPGSEFGVNIAQDSHYIVPAGKTGFITNVFTNVSKNHEADTVAMVSDSANEGYFSGGESSVYQNSTNVDNTSGLIGISSMSKIKFTSRSNNSAVDINVAYSVLLIDNEEVASVQNNWQEP